MRGRLRLWFRASTCASRRRCSRSGGTSANGCGETRALKKADPEVLSGCPTRSGWQPVDRSQHAARSYPCELHFFYPQRTQPSLYRAELHDTRQASVLMLAEIHDIPFSEPSDETIRKIVEANDSHRGEWDTKHSSLWRSKRWTAVQTKPASIVEMPRNCGKAGLPTGLSTRQA